MYLEDFEANKKYGHKEWQENEYITCNEQGEFLLEDGSPFYVTRWMLLSDEFYEVKDEQRN